VSKLTSAQIHTATVRKLGQALDAIQRAQDAIGDAREALSALEGAIPVWEESAPLYDTVRAFWYRVNSLRNNKALRLDRDHIAQIQKLMDENAATARIPRTAADQGDVP
jgi:hypothetical protein